MGSVMVVMAGVSGPGVGLGVGVGVRVAVRVGLGVGVRVGVGVGVRVGVGVVVGPAAATALRASTIPAPARCPGDGWVTASAADFCRLSTLAGVRAGLRDRIRAAIAAA